MGDDPDRLASEASFAALCGTSPVEASSGQTQRRRLNRGGDRQANAALYRIVFRRLRWDARTRDDLERRLAAGKTRRDAIWCLKEPIAAVGRSPLSGSFLRTSRLFYRWWFGRWWLIHWTPSMIPPKG